MCESSNQGIVFTGSALESGINSQLHAAATSLAQQLGSGDLDEYPADKAAAEQRLSSHIKAGDISYEEAGRLLAERSIAV
jgi:hypothetical protein